MTNKLKPAFSHEFRLEAAQLIFEKCDFYRHLNQQLPIRFWQHPINIVLTRLSLLPFLIVLVIPHLDSEASYAVLMRLLF
ncbi:hypothetical protein A28LD_2321 [Idiomarina sp. A28L]|nr:hypothetical protein A28LD_2321 [Idiomarina sp. A28L]